MRYLNNANTIALAINLLASLVFAVLSLLFAKYFIPDVGKWLDEATTISIANAYLLPFLLFIISFITVSLLFFSKMFIRVRGFSGREEIMSTNLTILKKYYSIDQTFWSTRLTFWNIAEDSSSRVAFRKFITQAVQDKSQVRRIWHVKSRTDYERLRFYLDSYKNFENYHVKVIITKDVYMPEMAGIGDRVAIVSLPASANPASIVNTIHFYRPSEIKKIREYFDLVWDRALPIKLGERVFTENIERVRRSVARSA